jgi:hypothetical protein
MHILASGPELQAVYFGHVIQTGSGEKRGLALRSLKKWIKTFSLQSLNHDDQNRKYYPNVLSKIIMGNCSPFMHISPNNFLHIKY